VKRAGFNEKTRLKKALIEAKHDFPPGPRLSRKHEQNCHTTGLYDKKRTENHISLISNISLD
jgi:hypothetical protein